MTEGAFESAPLTRSLGREEDALVSHQRAGPACSRTGMRAGSMVVRPRRSSGGHRNESRLALDTLVPHRALALGPPAAYRELRDRGLGRRLHLFSPENQVTEGVCDCSISVRRRMLIDEGGPWR